MSHDLIAYAVELLTLAEAHGLAERVRAATQEELYPVHDEIEALLDLATDTRLRALLYSARETLWAHLEMVSRG